MVKYGDVLKKFGVTPADIELISAAGVFLKPEGASFVREIAASVPGLWEGPYTELERWFEDTVNGRLNGVFLRGFGACDNSGAGEEKISRLFSSIREWFVTRIYEYSQTEAENLDMCRAFFRFIDASFFLANRDYILNRLGRRKGNELRSFVIRVSENFSIFTHTVLVLFLMGMTLGAMVYFVAGLTDIRDLSEEQMFVTALGSLLAVWVLVELLNSEIKMLKGDGFKLSVFVGVALIAFIRDLLIMTLKHEESRQIMIIIIGGILCLGATYWLLEKTERKK